MRHKVSGNRLNRNSSLLKATIRDLSIAVLKRERISTTKAKAKEARKMVDSLITLGKKGTLSEKRRAFAILCDHKLVSNLFTTIAPRFTKRAGGYTRIIQIGTRRGDNAELVYLELTEKKEVIISKPKKKGEDAGKDKAKAGEKSAVNTDESKSGDDSLKEKKAFGKKPVARAADDKGRKPKPMVSGLKKIFSRKTLDK